MKRETAHHWIAAVVTAAVALALGAAAQAQVPCRYVVEFLPTPPPCPFWDRYITPTAISPNGRWVCGGTGQCGPAATEAVVVDTKTMELRIIPRPPGVVSAQARDVNDAGLLVGRYDTISAQFGFIYDLNANQFLHQLAADVGGSCSIAAINASNVVCGTRTVTGSPEWKTTAFRWSAATGFQDLGLISGESTSAADINNNATVAGKLYVGDASRPFLWDKDNLTELESLMGLETFPKALNIHNQVVGQAATVQGGLQPHAFLAMRENMIDLGTLSGDHFSGASHLTDDGLVIGSSRSLNSSAPPRAVIWINGVIRDLNEMVPPNSGFTGLISANAISLDGVIAASAYVPGEGIACLLHPVFVTADVTGDCRVGVPDLLKIINSWGSCGSDPFCVSDINGDGKVNHHDLLLIIQNWGQQT